jgi:hypothetical protein
VASTSRSTTTTPTAAAPITVSRPATTLNRTSPSATINYGSSYRLTGTLSSGASPLGGQRVRLEASSNGTTFSATSVSATTSASGTFAFNVAPTTNSWYRARFDVTTLYAGSIGPAAAVSVRAYVGAPIGPATMSCGTGYAVYGYLKPRHAAGTYPLRVYQERNISGVWAAVGYVSAKAADYSTYTRYSTTLALPSAGTWRLRAYHAADAGNAATYSSWTTVTVTKGTPVLAATGSGTIAYGTIRTLSGTLKNAAGTALPGRTVTLKWAASPAATTWTSLASTRTVSTGAYTFRVAPTTTRYYRVYFAGDADYLAVTSPTLSVAVQVYLSAPTFSTTVYANRSVTAAGYVKPKHTVGVTSVQLQFYRYEGGVWVYKKTASTANVDYSTYTRYVATTFLPSTGSWRVRAYHAADSLNTATYSGWTTFAVH